MTGTKQVLIRTRARDAPESKGDGMKGRWVALLCASLVIALGALAPIARAGGVRLVAPTAYGTVDFGDRVLYRLEGAGCIGRFVHVHVDAGSGTDGPQSKAADDPLVAGTDRCVGTAQVPAEAQVRAAGWDAGDHIGITVVSDDGSVPLRYQRVEVDRASHELPLIQSGDGRSGVRDQAVVMSMPGDSVALGPVDLTRIYSISLRVCLTSGKPHVAPSLMELRAYAPDGPSIIGRVDVANDPNNSNKSNFGWTDCWQLQPWPILNPPANGVQNLYLVMVATGSPVAVTHIDFNGTGAKVADTPPSDPSDTVQIFDGDFKGEWSVTDKCERDETDKSVYPEHSAEPTNHLPLATFGFAGEDGCSMTYKADLNNVMIRLEYRMRNFGDNGAINLIGQAEGAPRQEVQMREAGEWMTGGLQGRTLPDALTNFATDTPTGYPAQRVKSNSYPDWSQMEIVKSDSRYIVRINGRTVTYCDGCVPDTGTFRVQFVSQPTFSYHYGVGYRMDTGPTNPTTDDPSNWGNLSFRNIRIIDCATNAGLCS
jgi:hypothetical protein